uniref:Uncharacterized protein n=1 Tax=Anguilla anguilla TaxID=7936 RepID=A0A0E9RKJ7_ANGAN
MQISPDPLCPHQGLSLHGPLF